MKCFDGDGMSNGFIAESLWLVKTGMTREMLITPEQGLESFYE